MTSRDLFIAHCLPLCLSGVVNNRVFLGDETPDKFWGSRVFEIYAMQTLIVKFVLLIVVENVRTLVFSMAHMIINIKQSIILRFCSWYNSSYLRGIPKSLFLWNVAQIR